MARALHKLTDVAVKAEKKPGRHSDGGGLYLNVTKTGSRSWLFMWTPKGGSRKEMGLGPYPAISLSAARKRAVACREQVELGGDPLEERKNLRTSQTPTFGQFADELIDAIEGGFRNQKHRDQWRFTLGDTYCKKLRQKQIDAVSTIDVLSVLQPIWPTKNETASRLRGRIERVLDAAKAKGLREGENPARWRGHLDALLPARKKLQRGHHPALDWREMPSLWEDIVKLDSVSASCLAFVILTACRSGEARGAQWSEIDLEAKLWRIPAERMKAGKPHTVPLSEDALQILDKMRGLRQSKVEDELVFPSRRMSKPLSDMALSQCLRGLRDGITVHGFRSTFRDWCGDATNFPRELAEQALAHVVGGVEGAYRRSDGLERRRKLMAEWAAYCQNTSPDNVVNFRQV